MNTLPLDLATRSFLYRFFSLDLSDHNPLNQIKSVVYFDYWASSRQQESIDGSDYQRLLFIFENINNELCYICYEKSTPAQSPQILDQMYYMSDNHGFEQDDGDLEDLEPGIPEWHPQQTNVNLVEELINSHNRFKLLNDQ